MRAGRKGSLGAVASVVMPVPKVRGTDDAIGERLARMCSSQTQSLCGVTTRKAA